MMEPHPKEGLTQPESVSPSVCHSDTSTVTVIHVCTENRKELSGDGNVMSEADCHLDQEKNSEDKAHLMSSHLNERDLHTSDQIQDTRTRCEDSDYCFNQKTNIEGDANVMSSRLSADERDLSTSDQIQDTRTLGDSDYHFDHKTNVEDSANERDLCTSDQIQNTRTLEDSDYQFDHKTNVEDSANEGDLCTSDQIQGMRRGCGVGVGLSSTGTTQSDCSSESPRFAGRSPVQVTNPGSRSPSEKNETDHPVILPTPTGETGDRSPPTKRARLDADVENSGLMGELELVLSGQMAGVTQRDLMNDDGDHHAAASVSLVYNLSKPPLEICHARTEFSETQNYLKGCKWSPDGSCLLTCSNDCRLRLFNLPEPLMRGETSGLEEMKSVLRMKEGETIYDYAWYPLMSSADPPTCCLVSTSGNTPVHMWDAFTGGLRCSYRAFNQVDEVVAAYSLSFSSDGNKLYCGFNKMIRVFDVERPGRHCQQRPTYVKEGQAGIISCIVTSPTDPGLYAAGSYSRSIALYHEPKGDMACMFQGQQGGVTHLQFTPDGTKLLSGGRKDCEILCWDLRHPGRILFTLQRDVQTNQRVYFDVDSSGRYLVSGNHGGTVRVWDMCGPVSQTEPGSEPVLEPELTYPAHDDTVNGASFHPSMPLIATSSGQRHFEIHGMDSEGEETEESTDRVDNSVRLWYI